MEKPITTISMKDNESDDPVSMYTLFARMFAHIAREVTDRFGEEGAEAVKAGVQAFGEERGRNIAERAKAKGLENDVPNYLPNYDMARSDDFTAENSYGEGEVRQLFTQCIFADQWIKDGTQKYGEMYCSIIDPAIAKGFNEDLECIHDQHIFTHGVCRFCFRMKK